MAKLGSKYTLQRVAILAYNSHIGAEAKNKLLQMVNGTWVKHPGTTEQLAIWQAMKTGTGHIVVDAGAGTGKTYTYMEGLEQIGGREMFNAKVECYTTHQLGRRALVDNGMKLGEHSLDKYLVGKELKLAGLTPDRFQDYKKLHRLATALVSVCKNTLLNPIDNAIEIVEMADAMGIEMGAGMVDTVMPFITTVINNQMKRRSTIDYDDMIWLPLILGCKFPSYDLVILDEAQDINAAAREMALRLVINSGRLMVVGDKRQAIYQFRGAGHNSIDELANELKRTPVGRKDGVARLPLMVSQRCPAKVVAMAKVLVPMYTVRENAPDGEVRVVRDMKTVVGEVVDGDMILCRVNAPLIGAAFEVLKSGKKAVIRGEAFGLGLVETFEELRQANKLGTGTYREYNAAVLEWYHDKMKALLAEGEDVATARIEKLTEQYECLTAMLKVAMESTLHRRIEEMKDNVIVIPADKLMQMPLKPELDRLLADLWDTSVEGVVLSTVHRSKGLEAKNVYLLHPELIPHPRASTRELRTEMNVLYIAITRAQNSFTFVGGITDAVRDWCKENGVRMAGPVIAEMGRRRPTLQNIPIGTPEGARMRERLNPHHGLRIVKDEE